MNTWLDLNCWSLCLQKKSIVICCTLPNGIEYLMSLHTASVLWPKNKQQRSFCLCWRRMSLTHTSSDTRPSSLPYFLASPWRSSKGFGQKVGRVLWFLSAKETPCMHHFRKKSSWHLFVGWFKHAHKGQKMFQNVLEKCYNLNMLK